MKSIKHLFCLITLFLHGFTMGEIRCFEASPKCAEWLLNDLQCDVNTDVCWAMLFIEMEAGPELLQIAEGKRISPELGFAVVNDLVPSRELGCIGEKYVSWLKTYRVHNPQDFEKLEQAYEVRQMRTLSSRHCQLAGALASEERDSLYAAMLYLSDHGAPGLLSRDESLSALKQGAKDNLSWLKTQPDEVQKALDVSFREHLTTRSAYFPPDNVRVFQRKATRTRVP